MTTIAAAVKKCIAEQTCVAEQEITPLHTFASFGADSLDMAEIVMLIEDELDAEIKEEELPMATSTTVEIFTAAIEKYIDSMPSVRARFVQ